MSKLREFYDSISKPQIEVSGFVKRMSDNRFILLPTMTTPQTYLQCSLKENILLPEENSYVRVEGRPTWSHLRRVHGNLYAGDRSVLVEDWKPDTLGFQVIPPIDYHEFRNEIFTNVLNIEPFLQDLLAFQIVSCPPLERFLGGLNLCLYDATPLSLLRRVIRQMTRIVPEDLGKTHILKTPIGKAALRYRFNWIAGNADEPLPEETAVVMRERTGASCDELSLSLGSQQIKPRSIEDPPCALSDLSTILNEDVDLSTKKLDPSLDAFKYMLAMHHRIPSMDDSESTILSLHQKFTELPNRYDIPPHQLARFKFLDASYCGKPQSILRLALADARIHGKPKATMDHANHMFHEYFMKNLDYTYEIWADLFSERVPIDRRLALSLDERKIVSVVERYQDTRSECVSFDELERETSLKPRVLATYLFDLIQTRGILMEPLPGRYKVVPYVQ